MFEDEQRRKEREHANAEEDFRRAERDWEDYEKRRNRERARCVIH